MKVGFIGVGAMGVPMVTNLVKAGHEVTAFDLRPDLANALAPTGATPATSAATCAANCEVLWLMVASGDQAASVLFDTGAAAALPKDAIVVAACTQSPAQAKTLAKRLAEQNITLLDAPVSGGTAGAKAATLTLMVSGPRDAQAKVRPVFEALGKRIYDLGPEPGQGSTMKMINQLLCGVHLAAAAEAHSVAECAGLDGALVQEIIGSAAAASWMWNDRGPRMLHSNPAVTSAVDIFVKDLGIVADEGRANRKALPLAAAALQMFLASSGLGHAREDDSQVIAAYRALNKLKP